MIDIDDFYYRFVQPPWCDIEDRPKFAKAIQVLSERMPADVYDELPGIILLALAPWKYGAAIYPPRVSEGDALIYFAPQLENEPQEQSDFTLAHEFAHVVLGHHLPAVMMAGTLEDASKGYLDQEHEKAADKLVVEWGYVLPSYRVRAKPEEEHERKRTA